MVGGLVLRILHSTVQLASIVKVVVSSFVMQIHVFNKEENTERQEDWWPDALEEERPDLLVQIARICDLVDHSPRLPCKCSLLLGYCCCWCCWRLNCCLRRLGEFALLFSLVTLGETVVVVDGSRGEDDKKSRYFVSKSASKESGIFFNA